MTSQAQTENYQAIKQEARGTHLLPWHYVGGYTYEANGSVVVNIPADATIFKLRARGGAVNFEINGATANAQSPGYVPEDQAEIEGPLANLTTLAVFGTSGSTYAHLMFYREV